MKPTNKKVTSGYGYLTIVYAGTSTFVFDEHDYTHRGTCFKSGKVECRRHLPEMASEDSIIFDNNDNVGIRRSSFATI